MKSPAIRDLQANMVVTATFLVLQKEVRRGKNGEPFLVLLLGDRTGELEARQWDNAAETADTFDRDDFVRAKGALHVHQGRLQMTVHKVQRLATEEVDLADFLPSSPRPATEMMAELNGIIEGLGNQHLKALLAAIFSDEATRRHFQHSPAAKTIHHAYLGGLLEHVLALCTLARQCAPLYPEVDLDLLLTGCILHDIGKIQELSYERSFQYTDEGQLLGHILIGMRMVDAALQRLPDFPPKLQLLIHHMLASHHGSYEFGSPKLPQFPEAMLLFQLDNLDSRMAAMRACCDRDKSGDAWTAYSSSLERAVLRKDRYLAAPSATPVSAAPPVTASKPSSPFASQLQAALRK